MGGCCCCSSSSSSSCCCYRGKTKSTPRLGLGLEFDKKKLSQSVTLGTDFLKNALKKFSYWPGFNIAHTDKNWHRPTWQIYQELIWHWNERLNLLISNYRTAPFKYQKLQFKIVHKVSLLLQNNRVALPIILVSWARLLHHWIVTAIKTVVHNFSGEPGKD